MDEREDLELLAALRCELTPTAEAVEHDRARLRRAIEAARVSGGRTAPARAPADGVAAAPIVVQLGGGGDDVSITRARRRPRRRAVVAAAASIAVLAGLAVVAARSDSGGDRAETSSAASAPAERSGEGGTAGRAGEAQAQTLACGTELPIDIPVPDGHTGPQDGPSGDGLRQPRVDQLVRHWTGESGSIEVRWPADDVVVTGQLTDPSDLRRPFERYHGAERNLNLVSETLVVADGFLGVLINSEPQPTPGGKLAFVMTFVSPDIGEGQCQNLQLMVADEDESELRRTSSQVHAALFAPGGPFGGPDLPLVAESTSAEQPPEVVACPAPEGVPHDDYQGGPVDDIGTHATAADALAAYVASQRVTTEDMFGIEVPDTLVVDRGYRETTLPDGSIAYTGENQVGDTTILVHAVQVDGGWTVDRWTASGC